MQATIYVTPQAMATVQALEGLDYYARADLMDKPETDLSQREGYYLSANSMRLAVLPTGADVAVRLVGADSNLSHRADRILSQGWKPTLRWSAGGQV